MSSTTIENDKTVLTPATLDILVTLNEVQRINFLNFQIISTLSGGSVNVTFTLECTNDPNTASSWKPLPTPVSKSYSIAGSNNDMLEVAWATAKAYRLKVTITAGSVDSVRVITMGKG